MAIAPAGTRIAAITRIKNAPYLIVTEDQKAIMTLPTEDLKARSVSWAGDDILIMQVSKTEKLPFGFTASKTEIMGAVIIPIGGTPELVFRKSAGISNAVFGSYGIRQTEGKWTGFYGGLELVRGADRTSWEFGHGRPALFAVDLAKNSASKVAPSAGEGSWRDWLVDSNGKVAATLDLGQNGAWEIRNADRRPIASGADPHGNVSLLSFGQSPDSVIYATEDQAEARTRWIEVPLAGGEAKEVLAHANVERVFISARDGTLLGYLDVDGAAPKAVFFSPQHQAAVNKLYAAFPKSQVSVMDWTPDLKRFLVVTRGNGDSGTYYLVDLTRLRADPVGYERPLIDPEQVGPISTVSYKAEDGLELDGILTLPPEREAKNLPALLLPHGGPTAHDAATFDWWAQAFASRGYAVFQPNFRGSTNRDEAFRHAGDGQWGRKMQTDISDGLAELARRGIVDPKRACIMGASYGGYAALAGVTLQQGIYRCAVAVAPVSDLKDMYWSEYRESGQSKMLRLNYEQALGDPSGFDAVSPRKNAANADAPILLIHGRDDTVVAFNQSTRMADALKKQGKAYELIELREEDHWLSRAETRKQMLSEAMRFVLKYNPPDQ